MQRRSWYRLFTIALFLLEVLIATRFARMPFVRGSLGDVLVTMLVYCFVLSIRDLPRVALAAGVFLFACAVETTQYLRLAEALHLERNGVLWIVLGSSFQWGDIVCYLVGCIVALGLDELTTPRAPSLGRS